MGARTGNRRPVESDSNWGGDRVKGPQPWVGEGKWLNADARAVQELKFEKCELDGGATN